MEEEITAAVRAAAAEMKRRCLEVARYQAEANTGEARQMALLIAAGIEALPE